MSMIELNSQAEAYFDILAQIEALQAEAEAIKDQMKAVMVDRTTEELKGDGWSATWHNAKSTRFDTTAFKKAHADLYNAFTKSTVTTRFTLCRVKAA